MTEATKKGYVWFQGKSVRELYDRLTAGNPDEARLEIRMDADGKTWLRVVSPAVTLAGDPATDSPADCGDINESHNCPPDC